MAACRWLKCSFCLLSLMCHLSTQALLVGDPIAVGRSTDLEYTQGQPCKLFFLNIIKKRLLLELATTSLGLCGTQRNTRTTGHITQFSQIQSWFQSSHTKNKYTQ